MEAEAEAVIVMEAVVEDVTATEAAGNNTSKLFLKLALQGLKNNKDYSYVHMLLGQFMKEIQ